MMDNNQPYVYPPQNNAAPVQPPAHGLAVASLACGIAGYVCCGIGSILAIIFGFVARSQGNREGITTAGIIVGIIPLALGILGTILYLCLFVFTSTLSMVY